jgi:anti-sigma B factor antagonist
VTGDARDLSVHIVRAGNVCTVTLGGELDLASSTRLNREFEQLLSGETRPATVHVDLRDVTFMDTMGIATLLTAHQRAATAGCRMSVVSMSPVIARLLEISGLTAHLTGAATRDAGPPPQSHYDVYSSNRPRSPKPTAA